MEIRDFADSMQEFILRYPVMVPYAQYLIAASALVMAVLIISYHYRRKKNIRTVSEKDNKMIASAICKDPGHRGRFLFGKSAPLIAAIMASLLGIAACIWMVRQGSIGSGSENPAISESKYTFGIDVSSYQ